MAGVHFDFINFKANIQLNIGIADRLDENRVESFTILFCDFAQIAQDVITHSLEEVLRNSDSIIVTDSYHFFVLPYTDKYGATVVKNMFEEFFDTTIPAHTVSYPLDGDTPQELLTALQAKINQHLHYDMECLDS